MHNCVPCQGESVGWEGGCGVGGTERWSLRKELVREGCSERMVQVTAES